MAGYKSYLVGGSIRDILMGVTPLEYDIATDAIPSVVQQLFNRTVPTGIKHGTVLVIFDGMQVEITTFRSDGDYSDGRHPDIVEYASTVEEDLPRRDLTINALAYDILNCNLIDMFDGIGDIERKIIRCVGNPLDRYKEDGLRVMRTVRFATKLGFEIEKNTFNALKESIYMLNCVAYERIRDEFNKILISNNPFNGFEIMRETGILEYILPELLYCYGALQNKYHKYDVYYHTLYTIANTEYFETDDMTLTLRLAALFHDIAKPIVQKKVFNKDEPVFYNHDIVGASVTKKIMRRFKYSNSQIALVSLLVKQHMFYYQDEWTDGAVRRFIKSIGVENIRMLLKLREADRLGSGKRKDKESSAIPKLLERVDKIIEAENAITVKDLYIDGHDIIKKFNLVSGPIIGEILNYLLELILDNPHLNDYNILLKEAQNYIENKNIGIK